MLFIKSFFVLLFIFSTCSCGNKLTKAFERDFSYYNKSDSIGFTIASINYLVLELKTKKVMNIDIWYKGEPYDSLLNRINIFHDRLSLEMPYIKDFKYMLYSVNSYSEPKRGNHYITKTHMTVLKALGATYSGYDPKNFKAEYRYKLIRDSINQKKL